MNILLDECLPRQLRRFLPEHSVVTVGEAGWTGFENGILAELPAHTFDVILTADKRFSVPAAKPPRTIAVVVLRAESNKLESLQTLIPQLLDALLRIRSGETIVLVAV